MRGFRDALRADPHLRRRYAALKRAIVVGGPADPVAFTRAKHDWIAATLTHLGLASHPPRRLYQDDLDLPISRTATTTQHSPRQEIASSAIPSSLRSCCGKHEPPPLPSCQRAISNRAQARANQEGTAPHSPPGCGPRRPQDKEPPCRESPEGSCRAPSWC